MEQREVAVTVFVMAEGMDEGDTKNVAVQAIRHVLDEAGNTLSVRALDGESRRVRVAGVMETGTAAANGYLAVRPAFRAYKNHGRDDTEDLAVEARSPHE